MALGTDATEGTDHPDPVAEEKRGEEGQEGMDWGQA